MTFDPYYKWLGIPPDEQPPNHYRLLGLSLFEQNTDAIDNAADRQMAHVRTFQAGPQGAHSQRLLNEIAAARVVLLDPAKKRAYDEQLRPRLASEQPPLAVAMPVPIAIKPATPMIVEVPASEPPSAGVPIAVFPTTSPAVQVQPRETAATARRPSKDMTVEIIKIIGGGIAGIVLATILLRFGFGIDMTGLFPVDQSLSPLGVVKKPKQIEEKKSPADKMGTTPVKPTDPSTNSAAEVMEEYDEPAPGGMEKKNKRKKGKSKANTKAAVSNGAAITVARMMPTPIEDGPNVIPELRGGTRFDWLETPTTVNVDLGRLEFTVQRTGWVYLVADWSIEGNDSGGWKSEAKSKDQLVSEGWEHLGRSPGSVDKPLELFRKVCKEGESYAIRVNKYWPPLAFIPGNAVSRPIDVGQPNVPSANSTSEASFQVNSTTLLPRRLSAPADAERQAAEQQLESTYQLSKLKEDAEKGVRAVELLALGLDRRARPAERLVTLRAAAELAADAGDARTVSQALDVLAQAFEPDVLHVEAPLLAKAARGARTADQMKALVERSRVTIQVALANHEYILARDLASAVRNASDRPAGQPYRKFIYDGQREIVRQQQAWYAYQEALTTLGAKPNDADANLVAAKWWILERGDWDAALKYLARADKPLLKTAAELDEAKGKDRLAIANAWYDAGQAELVNVLWLLRANRWYATIDKSQISGIDGALVDRRLGELKANEQLQPAWAQIAQGRGAARLHAGLAPVVRRHCVLAMPFERADHFHDGKFFMICDRSGQANHGALHGVKPASGQAGMALEFDGAEHFVECPDQPSLNPVGAITICAWLRQHSVVKPNRIDDVVSKEEWGGGTGRGYSLRLDEGRPTVNFGNGPDWLWVHAPQSPVLDTWFHLAAIYDGQNLVLLVNGVEVGVQPTNKSISVSPQPLRIGRGPFDQSRRFSGMIDEVGVFDMALTAADVQVIIDLGRAGECLAE